MRPSREGVPEFPDVARQRLADAAARDRRLPPDDEAALHLLRPRRRGGKGPLLRRPASGRGRPADHHRRARPGSASSLEAAEVVGIIPDIDGQIYARDFKLIDQADMIISLIPELEDGRPGLSSGVERELQHAHEATRDVFVIWQPDVRPLAVRQRDGDEGLPLGRAGGGVLPRVRHDPPAARRAVPVVFLRRRLILPAFRRYTEYGGGAVEIG